MSALEIEIGIVIIHELRKFFIYSYISLICYMCKTFVMHIFPNYVKSVKSRKFHSQKTLLDSLVNAKFIIAREYKIFRMSLTKEVNIRFKEIACLLKCIFTSFARDILKILYFCAIMNFALIRLFDYVK